MTVKEIIGSIFFLLAVCLILWYFIFRPLSAIGDIPQKIDNLTKVVKDLTNAIKDKHISRKGDNNET